MYVWRMIACRFAEGARASWQCSGRPDEAFDNKQATLEAAGACILNLTAKRGVKEEARDDAG